MPASCEGRTHDSGVTGVGGGGAVAALRGVDTWPSWSAGRAPRVLRLRTSRMASRCRSGVDLHNRC